MAGNIRHALPGSTLKADCMIFFVGIICNALDPCQHGLTLDCFSAQLLRHSLLKPLELSRLIPQRYSSSIWKMYLSPHYYLFQLNFEPFVPKAT